MNPLRLPLILSLSSLLVLPLTHTCTPLWANSNNNIATERVEKLDNNKLRQIAQAITVKVLSGDNGGSGVLIAKSGQDYTVVTNAHVITLGQPYRIQTPDGKVHEATLITQKSALRVRQLLLDGNRQDRTGLTGGSSGSYPAQAQDNSGRENDLAFLQFSVSEDYSIAEIDPDLNLAEGQAVFAAGFSYDSQQLQFTRGEVSLLSEKPLAGGYSIGYTNDIQQGMSGGAILNQQGKLIGINGKTAYAILDRAYWFDDGSRPTTEQLQRMREVAWGIPIETLTAIAPQLGRRSENTAQNLTGVAAQVDEIAKQITVLINAPHGHGSGVMIARQGNTYYVLTAAHVVKEQNQYTIVTHDRQEYTVAPKTVKVLPGADLAVVQFTSSQDYQVATLGKYNLGLEEKSWIFLSGFPEVESGSLKQPERRLSAGKVYSREKADILAINLHSLTDINGYGLVYTNLSQAGMSGGAVLDSRGRLIGIHAAAEAEIVIQESGEVAEFNLGRSLGVPIATFLGVAERANVKPQWLSVSTDKPTKLDESELQTIRKSFFTLQAPSDRATATDWLNYGNQLWRAERYEEAVTAIDRAIEIQPDFYQAYYARGVVFNGQDYQADSAKGAALGAQEKAKSAFAAFTKALEINPQFYEAWRDRSRNRFFYLEQYGEALADIEQAITLQPNDWNLYSLKSSILVELSRYSEALKAANQALALNSDYLLAYLDRGFAYARLGETKRAFADYNRALKINPEYEAAYLLRGIVYRKLENYQKAFADLNRVLEINPEYHHAYLMLALTYQELEQYDQAFANLEQAIKINPEYSDAYITRGGFYLKLKEFERGVADLTQGIKFAPQDRNAYQNRGYAYLALGKHEQAIADFTQVLQLQSSFSADYLYKNEEDLLEFQNLTAQEAGDYHGYFGRCYAYVHLEQYESAIADCTRAIEISPEIDWSYVGRAASYWKIEKYQEAIADYSRVIELENNRRDISDAERASSYSTRGLVYFDSKDYNRAIEDYTTALKLHPEDSSAYKNRGKAYLQLKKYEPAIADFSKAIEINPNDAEFYILRGTAHYELKGYEPAIADATQALEINPQHAGAYLLRGFAYSYLKEYQKVISDTTKALEINPQYTEAYYARGSAYYKQGDYPKALSDYEAAIALKEDFLPAYVNIGLIRYETEDINGAIAQWQKAVEIDSEEAEPQLALAVALYTQGDREQGLEMARAAIEKDSRLADIDYLKTNLWGNRIIASLQTLLEDSRWQAEFR